MLKKLFITFFILSLLVVAGLCGGLYYLVVVEPGEEISEENIQSILGKESNVYFSDGETKLGAFFDTAHRQYVYYQDIPQDFVNALVSSEDERFFSHFGFDPMGILRASIKNVQAGRVVQGGSTLTQQTAKNLFKRTERSFEAKLKELVFALRLEHRYPKEKIFEFYANQFYVSGNGHGLGVAARYYFDKLPEQLTLAECAFIAGSVKRPNFYNPFIKKTADGAAQARQQAQVRLRYVLDKMKANGSITASQYDSALSSPLEFSKGQVGFALDYAMELVRDAVSSTPVLNALGRHDISNIATSGVRIVTTIDQEIHSAALAALRHELSRLDVRLRGYERAEVQEELATLDYKGDDDVLPGSFIFGTVSSVSGEKRQVQLTVILDKKLGTGVIDADGLDKLVEARAKWEGHAWSEAASGDLMKLVAQVRVGDRVWVSVRTAGEDGQLMLNLEKYPQVQGGALAMKNGRIVGMAGGTENRFFNRAVHAKRTMGSAFKPLVYAAALQLGWNSTDLLKNARELFVFHNQPYFPRPDHNSPHDWVSMSWAGVHSENLASVWLASRLCDKMGTDEFKELAGHLGLLPRLVDGEEEPYRSYAARIRDRLGILVNREALHEAAYYQAVRNVETDLIFDNLSSDYPYFTQLHYGRDFDRFEEQVLSEMAASSGKESELKELRLRLGLLQESFLQLKGRREQLAAIEQQMGGGSTLSREYDPFATVPIVGLWYEAGTGRISYLEGAPQVPGYRMLQETQLREFLQGADEEQRKDFWGRVQLGGVVSVAAFDKVAAQTEHEYRKLLDLSPYSFEVLSTVPDFRTTAGLLYLVELAREMGISSALEPVLSFPLGSNVVTLLEATRMYEGLVTGVVQQVRGDDEEGVIDALAVLDRIESEDGEILYQPEVSVNRVMDQKTSMEIGHILENVVKFGTGRRAGREIRLTAERRGASPDIAGLETAIPAIGKTGTANRYTNASFLGYLPGVADSRDGMSLENGYALGVYVGFDDNQDMRKRSSRIAGSEGALPTWCDLANAIIDREEYAGKLDPVDLSFYGLHIKRNVDGRINLAVNADGGGVLIEPVVEVSEADRERPSIMTFGTILDTGRLLNESHFRPFWRNVDPLINHIEETEGLQAGTQSPPVQN